MYTRKNPHIVSFLRKNARVCVSLLLRKRYTYIYTGERKPRKSKVKGRNYSRVGHHVRADVPCVRETGHRIDICVNGNRRRFIGYCVRERVQLCVDFNRRDRCRLIASYEAIYIVSNSLEREMYKYFSSGKFASCVYYTAQILAREKSHVRFVSPRH